MSIETIIATGRKMIVDWRSRKHLNNQYAQQMREKTYEQCADELEDALDQLSACRTAEGEAVVFRYRDPNYSEKLAKGRWSRWLPVADLCHYDRFGKEVKGPHEEWQVEYAYAHPAKAVPEGVNIEATDLGGVMDYEITTCRVCLRSLESCDEKLCPGKFGKAHPPASQVSEEQIDAAFEAYWSEGSSTLNGKGRIRAALLAAQGVTK